MPRKSEHRREQQSALRRAASAVKRLFGRGGGDGHAEPAAPAEPLRARTKETPKARPTRREADIPLDVLDRAYTPPLTSSKSSFRSDGADHQQDQEFAAGVADTHWNDEDHYTNKSGDPRIGTHRRTYEPGEARAPQND